MNKHFWNSFRNFYIVFELLKWLYVVWAFLMLLKPIAAISCCVRHARAALEPLPTAGQSGFFNDV